MSNNNVTTSKSFYGEPIDITHKSKKTQHDNIMQAMGKIEEEEQTETSLPSFITLEKAITYYTETFPKKTGSEKTLFEQTAKWLKELLTSKQTKTPEKE